MRIIAGDKRGSKLASLPGEETRPTLERVKEAIFSAANFLLPGASVLDLFAGSGQLGLEALSRGSVRCTFVDSSPHAVAVVNQNIRSLGYLEKSLVLCMNSADFLRQSGGAYDIVFLDPPYHSVKWDELLQNVDTYANAGACVFCEAPKGTPFPLEAGELKLIKVYPHGTACVARYSKSHPEA